MIDFGQMTLKQLQFTFSVQFTFSCNTLVHDPAMFALGAFKKMKEDSVQKGDLEGSKLYKNRNFTGKQKFFRPRKSFF